MKSGQVLFDKNSSLLLQEIKGILEKNVSEQAIAAAKKFVPGAQKIYGVRNPVLNELAKKYKHGGFDLIKALWESGAFEEKILAAKMLGKIANTNSKKSFELVEMFSNGIDNWAVCDTLGMQSLQPLRKKYPKEIFSLANKYVTSEDLWKRRLSLVLIEWYTRDKSFHEQIKSLITALENDKEYYVKKAVVWIKRNLQKGK